MMQLEYSFDPVMHLHKLGEKVIPGATELLRDAGFEFPSGDMAMGKAVHLACELDDLGQLDGSSVSDPIYPYLEGWRLFRKETGFAPTRIEEPHCNRLMAFAAVLDREGVFPSGKKAIVEIKKYSPPFFTGIQLALQELTLPSAKRVRMSVELKDNGTYKQHFYTNPNDKNFAMFLPSLYWYKRNKTE